MNKLSIMNLYRLKLTQKLYVHLCLIKIFENILLDIQRMSYAKNNLLMTKFNNLVRPMNHYNHY